MIAYLNGIIMEKSEDSIVMEVNNIGYNLRVSNGYDFPMIGESVKVFTYTYVKEDAFLLYGFMSQNELKLFKLLITVNGIGPKGALAILSIFTPQNFYLSVLSNDISGISKAPGVGKKTAERIIIDLKDKVGQFSTDIDHSVLLNDTQNDVNPIVETAKQEASEALKNLGYSATEIKNAISQISTDVTTAEEILKQALKYLM